MENVGISVIWKAVLAPLDVIRFGMDWKVGNGRRVCIGIDPWTRINLCHILLNDLVGVLEQNNFLFLPQVGDEMYTSIFHQGWKTRVQLSLNEDHCRVWGDYVLALQRAHIFLSDADDTLVWDKTLNGKYNPKAIYLSISVDPFIHDYKWWRRGIWKVNFPAKNKLFG